MNILLVSGSPRRQARTRFVTHQLKHLVEREGAHAELFDVGINILPLFGVEHDQNTNPTVISLSEQAGTADAFVIVSPEYHNGISGALKNAIDFLGSAQFDGKPVIIAATCGGGKGGINALNQLRIIMRGVGALVLPDQTVVDPESINTDGEITDASTVTRLEEMVKHLVSLTAKLDAAHSKVGDKRS